MNTDTIRSVEQTKKNGYYLKSMTLGVGGWNELYKHTKGWGHYLLDIDNDIVCEIMAKNDDAAIKAFHSLYNLDSVSWEVYEKITTVRTVDYNFREE